MTNTQLRTQTGATIVEVFWLDLDRQTAGLLCRDSGSTTWADVYHRNDLPRVWTDLRGLAAVVIEDGAAVYAGR